MMNLIKKVRGFTRGEKGQGLVEYALILVLVAIVVVASMKLIGCEVQNTYTNIAGALR
jgi:pilus assembly protein Flp/PilA